MDKEAEEEYKKDTRVPCKYGINCYQKNAAHISKFKHPPSKQMEADVTGPPTKKYKANNFDSKCTTDETDSEKASFSSSELDTDSEESLNSDSLTDNKVEREVEKQTPSTTTEDIPTTVSDVEYIPSKINEKEFIKNKFLVEMPQDFYDFWNFCKDLNSTTPLTALKDVGLTLVGPFEVLAGKFSGTPIKNIDEYALHWRYYYDPPEFQTVIKRNDNSGYHLGYVRDSPDEMPVFLAYNFANKDGTFTVVGDNLFAAVSSFLKFLMKNANPFMKVSISRYNNLIQKEAEKLKLNLSTTTPKITARNKKISSRTFNKLGIVVPYNKKTQVGYRPLLISNKELLSLLSKIDDAKTDSERDKLMVKLQEVLTCTNIALDECDFGTGLELGLNILCSGVESLNSVAGRFLSNSYKLLNRESFAIIAESHMKRRQKDFNKLSVI